jgi:hypothetical protein
MLNDKLNYDQVPNKEAWGISDERTENFMKEKVMLVLQNVQKPTADQMKEAEDYVIKEVQQYLDCIGNILQHFLTSISNNYTETQSSHYLEKKESKIKGAGLGLFTNKFIKRGEIITRYPFHIIIHKDVNDTKVINISGHKDCYTKDDNPEDFYERWESYGVHIVGEPEMPITDLIKGYADCNPEFNKNQDFLGYQANDNAFDPTSQKNKYHIQRNNAEFQHKSLIIATRDINKGEEIYLSYGKDFWFESEERGDRVISRADEIRYGMTKEDYDKSKPNKKSKKNQKKIKRR